MVPPAFTLREESLIVAVTVRPALLRLTQPLRRRPTLTGDRGGKGGLAFPARTFRRISVKATLPSSSSRSCWLDYTTL